MARAYAPGLAVIAALACSAGDDVPAPRLSALQPASGAPGLVVEVLGEYLCQVPHPDEGEEPAVCPSLDATLWFGTVAAPADVVDDTRATATVPVLAPGAVDVHLTVAGRGSNILRFTVLAP
ncbi:MAG: hypothetical protein KA190_22560 [Kofleriaceae bacterium]|jgi:hypothetical protein|nr:hypothetical protein [Kofleriaceae bacterium]